MTRVAAASGFFLNSNGVSLVPAVAPWKHWGTVGVSQEEDGVRDHQTSQISTCFMHALANGEHGLAQYGLAVFSASGAALDTHDRFSWSPAEAGTCPFSLVHQCGNASSDRHVPFTLKGPDEALWDFKIRKILRPICGCHVQITMMASFGAWRPSWCISLIGSLWMKGPQGKCNFPTWRILSTGYEALYDQGIRSAIFQASLIVCLVTWVDWWMVCSCCCSSCLLSPLPSCFCLLCWHVLFWQEDLWDRVCSCICSYNLSAYLWRLWSNAIKKWVEKSHFLLIIYMWQLE